MSKFLLGQKKLCLLGPTIFENPQPTDIKYIDSSSSHEEDFTPVGVVEKTIESSFSTEHDSTNEQPPVKNLLTF